jgi:NAD-dependent dihydropyrimidine dehydrogenase PreA subunit
MPIESLDQDMCTGCSICVDACPEDVLYMDEEKKKACIRYPEDCVACFACEFFCPVECIQVSKDRAYELPFPY